jgi:hypothetical protein
LGPRLRPASRPDPTPSLTNHRIPQRYRITEANGIFWLSCSEAPTLRVRAELGLSFTESEARNAAPGNIFIDGVAQAPPFADLERGVLNLDHHEGCVRAFTLSSCEQALVLLRKGLDLRRREWTIYANGADLDSVFAIWLLLNHLRLEEAGGIARERVLPLLRLEGAIDAHGLECADLCGFPPDLAARTRDQMAQLRAHEQALRSSDAPSDGKLLDYLASQLRRIDAIAYTPAQLRSEAQVEELARCEIGSERIAIVCRSSLGIYETERQLRRFHGERLGVLALIGDAGQVTLRQLDLALPATLERVYSQLNWVDPAITSRRSANRWGGSPEIGGSPRQTGTRLEARQLADVFPIAYRASSRRAHMARRATLLLVGIALPCIAALLLCGVARVGGLITPATRLGISILGIALVALAISARRNEQIPGPRGVNWRAAAILAPLAALWGAAGGCWAPSESARSVGTTLASLLTFSAGIELWLRGWLHSRLVGDASALGAWRRWLQPGVQGIATAVLALGLHTSLGFAAPTSPFVGIGSIAAAPSVSTLWHAPISSSLLPVLFASAFGASLAMLRERSGRLWPSIVVHASTALWIGLAR